MPTKEIFNLGDGIVLHWTNSVPNIKKVIFHDPATIVYWGDGSKTVVKVQEGDEWDAEKGLAMAVFKKIYGLDEMKKWLPIEEYDDDFNETMIHMVNMLTGLHLQPYKKKEKEND